MPNSSLLLLISDKISLEKKCLNRKRPLLTGLSAFSVILAVFSGVARTLITDHG